MFIYIMNTRAKELTDFFIEKTYTMISDHYENDTYLDQTGTLIRRLCDRTNWSGKYTQQRNELIKELESKQYI